MTILMVPLTILSWVGFALDSLIDNDSANPSSFIVFAKKTK